MNQRRNLLVSIVAVLLVVAALAPAAQKLSVSTDKTLDEKQSVIARALEMQTEREAEITFCQVQPYMDIEEIWAIEDTREQTDDRIVAGMISDTGEMGFDAANNTYYCTLGLENGDAWPELHLSAYGEAGVQVVWIDDYSYDWCADAIAEGYRYELLAYTDTQYAYIGVVFTGLPIVTLHAQGEIDYDYNVPGRVTVAAAGHAPVESAMIVHERGGKWVKPIDKPSYRVEMYALGYNGKAGRNEIGLLGMDPDSEWLLLSNAQDEFAVRNKILYDMWAEWNEDDPALMMLDSELVEVFEGDEYMGIYQLMERVKPEEEIALVGGDVRTDCVVRGIVPTNPSDKPVWDLREVDLDFCLEYRYEYNDDADRAFELAENYVALCQKEEPYRLSDEEFTELALECVDIEDMLNYYLFYHGCTLRDNSANNLYLYIMRQEDGRYVYRHAPWDMDTGLWIKKDFDSHEVVRWPDLNTTLPTRMLNLNVGNCRERMWEMWNEKRLTLLSEESMTQRISQMESLINASGAYLRETEKWHDGAYPMNLGELEYYAVQCLILVRLTLESTWPVEGMTLVE